MSWLSKLLGTSGPGTPGKDDQAQGMKEYLDAIKEFEKGGNNQYQWLGDLNNLPSLSNSEMENIKTDPAYGNYEQAALRDLETQSKDGLSARDLADLAQSDGRVNRQNAGRIGAIQQNMAARGMSGSGMELVAQMQAAQDATEQQALASLEKNAQAQQARRDATSQLGQLSSQLQGRDFQQQAQKAAAQDAINRFNTANQVDTARYNHAGRQSTADQNVNQNNQFAKDKLSAQQGGGQMRYNAGTEANNQSAMRHKNNVDETLGYFNAVTNGAKNAAGAAAAFSGGGKVPGMAKVPGDHSANDTVVAMLSPGEVVVPRSLAQDDGEIGQAVDALLEIINKMQKSKR
jgi:hypothetical protein